MGHYWGQEYNGPRGKLAIFQGEKDVYFHWKDSNSQWNKTPLAKEILEIWIMPKNYNRSWKRFFYMHRSIPPKEIYSGSNDVIYGWASHNITSMAEFEKNLKQANSTRWPDSPHNGGDISWYSWQTDINKLLSKSK